MTPEREREFDTCYSVLTEEEWAEGWRICVEEWDGLLVNVNTSPECKNCSPDRCGDLVYPPKRNQ